MYIYIYYIVNIVYIYTHYLYIYNYIFTRYIQCGIQYAIPAELWIGACNFFNVYQCKSWLTGCHNGITLSDLSQVVKRLVAKFSLTMIQLSCVEWQGARTVSFRSWPATGDWSNAACDDLPACRGRCWNYSMQSACNQHACLILVVQSDALCTIWLLWTRRR